MKKPSPVSPSATLVALRMELIQMIELDRSHQSKPLSATEIKASQTKGYQATDFDAASIARTLLNGWSHDNTGRAIYELVEQAIGKYAKKNPFQLLGISFVLGVSIVLVKPWRRFPSGLSAIFSSIFTVKFYKFLVKTVLKKA